MKVSTLFCITCAFVLIFSCKDNPVEINQEKVKSQYAFTVNNDRIYAVSNDQLLSFRLANQTIEPTVTNIDAFKSEVVYSNDTMLVLLSKYNSSENNGYGTVYGIKPDASLDRLGTLNIFPCDQMVIKNEFIFQLRKEGNDCHIQDGNALVVTDLSNNLTDTTFIVTTPSGICVDKNILFLAHGSNGLSVYDVHNPMSMTLIKHYDAISGEKVDAVNGILIIADSAKIAQYDYSDLNNIKLLSTIPIQQ